MERKAEIQKTIYDNAKSHFLGNFPDSLPIEQAYVHIGMYLGWIIDQDMYSEYFEEEASIHERDHSEHHYLIHWNGTLQKDTHF